MKRISKDWVESYLAEDAIARMMREQEKPHEASLVCQRWLRETPPKRLIFQELYGDLLASGGRRVLDVGGGLTTFTRLLGERNDFELLDLLAHDGEEEIRAFRAAAPAVRLTREDWFTRESNESYDVIVANDLFPNVDQRLELFLEKYLPNCREMRLSITVYNTPRYYLTRRIEGDEILCLLAWNGEMAAMALAKFLPDFGHGDRELLATNSESPYPNKRQLFLVRLNGGLAG